MTTKDTVKQQIKQVLDKKYKLSNFQFTVNYPPVSAMGDYSVNVAMLLAKDLKRSPFELAEELAQELATEKMWQKVVALQPGFINFYLSEKFLQENLKIILKEKEKFGQIKPEKKEKIMLEFVSANPTGPLTLANGRGGFTGDVLANVLATAGNAVKKEYYVNDVGNQINILGHSVLKDAQAQYKGEYIDELKKEIKATDPNQVGQEAAQIILEKYIKPVIKKAGIEFDNFFAESELHDSGSVEKMLAVLKKKDLVYEKDGATWLKTTDNVSTDDKDRVLIKSDGSKTYFLADIAYHFNKLHDRKFNKVINLWGADHHGYVARMKQAVALLGYPNQLEVLLMQMVRLIKDGQEFKMSKRAGVYVTLEELIDMVGLDVTRFFFLMHSNNKTMDFDLNLAEEKSNKNPVFYVQYAHARICSILEKAPSLTVIPTEAEESVKEISRLKTTKKAARDELKKEEKELITELIKWPEIIEEVTENYEVHKVCFYAIALADKFHDFYENCRVINENNLVNEFRLNLIQATQQTLKSVLKTLGVSAPEKM